MTKIKDALKYTPLNVVPGLTDLITFVPALGSNHLANIILFLLIF